jgi:hypothetical protein
MSGLSVLPCPRPSTRTLVDGKGRCLALFLRTGQGGGMSPSGARGHHAPVGFLLVAAGRSCHDRPMRAFICEVDQHGLRRLVPEDLVPGDELTRYASAPSPPPTTVARALLADGDAEDGVPIATEKKATNLVRDPGFTVSELLETRSWPSDSRKPIREWLSRTPNSRDRVDSPQNLVDSRKPSIARVAYRPDRCFLLRCYRILGHAGGRFRLAGDGLTVSARLLEGRFPAWREALPARE